MIKFLAIELVLSSMAISAAIIISWFDEYSVKTAIKISLILEIPCTLFAIGISIMFA